MFFMSLLSINWAAEVWKNDSAFYRSNEYFTRQIREVFAHPAGGREVSMQFRQGYKILQIM